MIEAAIMIEGQNGLTWERWKGIAKVVDDLGFAGLYRSDHYTNANPPDKESLELWTSLTWLASHTQRIEFGPLVSPVSFRHPTMTVRMAVAVDDLSNGRLILGLGAGWQEREHHNYGWDLMDIPRRFARFEEGLEVISRLLKNDMPSNFEGDYYNLREGVLLPRPKRAGGPPILIGGNGLKRTLPLVARYADEWNAVYLSIPEFQDLNDKLDEMLVLQGRKSSDVRRSLMIACIFGRDDAEVGQKVATRTQGNKTPQELRDRDFLVGTANQIVDKLGQWAEAGIHRVMLQWLDLDDIAGLELLAEQVLPQL
jgi:F420-dependent oxidoreductase-like protein